MRKTTRLKKPQIPELDTLYQFDDLGGRPKYGGVEMTSATDIPSFEEIQRHVDGAITAEAAARSAADDDLEEAIDAVEGGLEDEIADRAAADNNLQSEIDAIVASSDVKDIVGTKAELDNYDTSTLGDNDIIKVLQDETQQDQTTYYRWVAATETFTLIGAEGPYYTKSATDALLDDKADKADVYTKTEIDSTVDGLEDDIAAKQDQLTAGSNINIDANNVISGTYTHFTGATASTDGVQGLVPGPLAGDEDKFLKADGTWDTVQAGPTVVQTTGTSTTDVMSQNAASTMIYKLPNESGSSIVIGKSAIMSSAFGSGDNMVIGNAGTIGGSNGNGFYNMAIGYGTNPSRNDSDRGAGMDNVAIGPFAGCYHSSGQAHMNDRGQLSIGYYAATKNQGSTAIGAYSYSETCGEVAFGSTNTGFGYNSSNYRLLTGLYDPQSAHDAATKGYVDGLVGNIAAALNAINNGGGN